MQNKTITILSLIILIVLFLGAGYVYKNNAAKELSSNTKQNYSALVREHSFVLGNHDAKVLRRLVLPGGSSLRPILPGRPTPDCLFRDTMRDGVTGLKVWNRNEGGGAVVAAFNVQGSYWCREQRKYISQPEMIHPVQITIRPVDVPAFTVKRISLAETFKNTPSAIGEATLEILKQNLGPGGNSFYSDQAFVAWSAKTKELFQLPSGLAGVNLELESRDWDMFSISPVFALRKKSIRGILKAVRSRQKPFIWGLRRMREMMVGSYSNIYDEAAEYYEQVLWAPIGLVDMFNAGGAVLKIVDSASRKNAKSAKMIAKGSGRFGIYSSVRPKSITLSYDNGKTSKSAQFMYSTSGPNEGLIEFDLPYSDEIDKDRSVEITCAWNMEMRRL